MAQVIQGSSFEGSDLVVLARIVDSSNTAINQGAVSAAAREVWDVTDKPSVKIGATATLTVADVVYNALQTGGAWTQDEVGYNFRDVVPAASMPTTEKTAYPTKRRVAIEHKLTLSGGSIMKSVTEIDLIPSLFGK